MKTKLTPFAKLLIVVVVLAALGFAVKYLGLVDFNQIANSNNNETNNQSTNVNSNYNANGKTIRVGVVTWGGYAGGEYFNRGFKPNGDSRYLKEYGFNVEFKVLDDFNASRDAWKSDKVDLL